MDKDSARIYPGVSERLTIASSSASSSDGPDDAGTSSASPTSEPNKFSNVHPLACFRISPRPCINHKLVAELKILRWNRFLEHGCTS